VLLEIHGGAVPASAFSNKKSFMLVGRNGAGTFKMTEVESNINQVSTFQLSSISMIRIARPYRMVHSGRFSSANSSTEAWSRRPAMAVYHCRCAFSFGILSWACRRIFLHKQALARKIKIDFHGCISLELH